MALRKMTIALDESLIDTIEAYAKDMHLNRTAAISVLCSTALEARKNMQTLDDLMKLYKSEQNKQGSIESADG